MGIFSTFRKLAFANLSMFPKMQSAIYFVQIHFSISIKILITTYFFILLLIY